MYTCMHSHVHMHICVRVYLCIYACVRACIYRCVHMCMRVYRSSSPQTNWHLAVAPLFMRVYTYTHVCRHMYTHAYVLAGMGRRAVSQCGTFPGKTNRGVRLGALLGASPVPPALHTAGKLHLNVCMYVFMH
jgi:hypothetical protein